MKRKIFASIKDKLADDFELITEDGDHEAFEVWKDDKYITHVKNSRSPKDFQDQLIANNLFLSMTNLKKYKDCSYKNEQLIANAKRKGRWPS